MNWIYCTPDKRCGIKQQSDSTWEETFGIDPVYLICVYDQSLRDYNEKAMSNFLSDYYIIQSEETLNDCFRWLVKEKVISQEEMDVHEWLWGAMTDLDKNRKVW